MGSAKLAAVALTLALSACVAPPVTSRREQCALRAMVVRDPAVAAQPAVGLTPSARPAVLCRAPATHPETCEVLAARTSVAVRRWFGSERHDGALALGYTMGVLPGVLLHARFEDQLAASAASAAAAARQVWASCLAHADATAPRPDPATATVIERATARSSSTCATVSVALHALVPSLRLCGQLGDHLALTATAGTVLLAFSAADVGVVVRFLDRPVAPYVTIRGGGIVFVTGAWLTVEPAVGLRGPDWFVELGALVVREPQPARLGDHLWPSATIGWDL